MTFFVFIIDFLIRFSELANILFSGQLAIRSLGNVPSSIRSIVGLALRSITYFLHELHLEQSTFYIICCNFQRFFGNDDSISVAKIVDFMQTIQLIFDNRL